MMQRIASLTKIQNLNTHKRAASKRQSCFISTSKFRGTLKVENRSWKSACRSVGIFPNVKGLDDSWRLDMRQNFAHLQLRASKDSQEGFCSSEVRLTLRGQENGHFQTVEGCVVSIVCRMTSRNTKNLPLSCRYIRQVESWVAAVEDLMASTVWETLGRWRGGPLGRQGPELGIKVCAIRAWRLTESDTHVMFMENDSSFWSRQFLQQPQCNAQLNYLTKQSEWQKCWTFFQNGICHLGHLRSLDLLNFAWQERQEVSCSSFSRGNS